jgi:nitroimidazol reductase NimA-like FMN-containing flavoprotein (pyridoxamine 5'-phosphate oxidase superfamily)
MPVAQPLDFPALYGEPEVLLAWEDVSARLEAAKQYWLATVRPDGRPHVVPLDGNWIGDAWYFGGSPETVKYRNLSANPHAALHLEDANSAVIVEGVAEVTVPDDEFAERLAELSKAKYGYGPPASVYKTGVWRLEPVRVLAWTQFPRDATRFRFE